MGLTIPSGPGDKVQHHCLGISCVKAYGIIHMGFQIKVQDDGVKQVPRDDFVSGVKYNRSSSGWPVREGCWA